MKRYYLSKIKGAGTAPNPIRHRIQELTPGVDFEGGQIKVGEDGQPTESAILVLVGAIDHRALATDDELIPMPDVPQDMKVSSIHTATKLSAKQRIKDFGFDAASTDDVWGNADGFRDVLNHYGRLNDDEFDVNNFDLTDL